jgi:phosphotriesterase-related protein
VKEGSVADVQTVTGPIDTSALGRVLMHEHVVVLNPEIQANYPGRWADGRWEEEAGIAHAAEKLHAVKDAGFDTLVDVSVLPMGRDIPRIAEISRRSGLRIIAATGLYAFDEVPTQLNSVAPKNGDDDTLVDLFVRDIEVGAADTGIRSAIIKVATDAPGITSGTDRILRAAARAHRRTGAPITTHSKAATRGGLEQQRVFAEEGVDLSRVIIGHCGDTTDLEYLEELIDAGSFIGMDRFGLDYLLPFEERVGVVADMCARGHADRMVLSHDTFAFNDWFSADVMRQRVNWHYLHIQQDVLPALQRRGVTDDQIDAMLVRNPRAIFENTQSY